MPTGITIRTPSKGGKTWARTYRQETLRALLVDFCTRRWDVDRNSIDVFRLKSHCIPAVELFLLCLYMYKYTYGTHA
jgi:hypothetical protein